MKLKDRNRKQKEREEKKTPEKIKTSTKRVQKHRKTLNIKSDFKKGNSRLNRSEQLRKQKSKKRFHY